MKVRCPRIIKKIISPIVKLYGVIVKKYKRSIRLELLFIFGVCLLGSMILGSIINHTYIGRGKVARIDYSLGVQKIENQADYIAHYIKENKVSINDKKSIEDILQNLRQDRNYKILITDLDGKVLYKTDNANDVQVDIYTTIKNSMDTLKNWNDMRSDDEVGNRNTEYVSFYPGNFTDGRGYIIVSGIPEPEIVYNRYSNPLPGALVVIASFLISFYFITNRKMKYIEVVSNGLLEISKGNLEFRIKKMGEDELALLADNINFMAGELKNKIEDERKAERVKSELITNVSHDLRTPLTSIKGYLGLIKDKKYTEDSQLEQYVNIAYNKSERLETLINDLFEYTKLSNGTVAINSEDIALDELLDQLNEELVPICEENDVSIFKEFRDKKVFVHIDPDKTVRVFENLLINAIRYSYKPGIIKLVLSKEQNFALVSIQNKCDALNEEDLGKLFDRFYRVDKARSSDTGGSGLGLAIAKNIVELQKGSIDVKYESGIISFNVKLRLNENNNTMGCS